MLNTLKVVFFGYFFSSGNQGTLVSVAHKISLQKKPSFIGGTRETYMSPSTRFDRVFNGFHLETNTHTTQFIVLFLNSPKYALLRPVHLLRVSDFLSWNGQE